MKTRPRFSIVELLSLFALAMLAGNPSTSTAMVGMLTPVGDRGDTYVAYPVNLEPNQVVQSIRWYNNDGSTALPSISLVGLADGSPDLSNVLFTTTEVYACSDAWAQVNLPQPSGGSDLFVVFRLPALPRSAIGVGGGPGIGYDVVEATLSRARISADGVDWVYLPDTIALGVVPVVGEAGGVVSKGIATTGEDGSAKASMVYRTALQSAYPNPANPSVRVKFTLGEATSALVSVYNVRGQRVATLVDRWLPVGEHQVHWLGTDDSGGSVGSGVYFVRFEASGVSDHTRVTLVR